MLDKALSAVEKYNMLSPGSCGHSRSLGGADSMAMLLFLMKISERYSLSLTVAHVNHRLRGEEARRDEEYVRSFCEKNSLRFEVLHADVAALAKQSGETCEECGRRVRYEFFESIDKNAKIATAHTASDNAETMLFNLARGSSLKGLCGIPPGSREYYKTADILHERGYRSVLPRKFSRFCDGQHQSDSRLQPQ